MTSSDPASPHTMRVSGDAPPGELAVAGIERLDGAVPRIEVDHLGAQVPLATLPLELLGLEVHGEVIGRHIDHIGARAVGDRVPFLAPVQ